MEIKISIFKKLFLAVRRFLLGYKTIAFILLILASLVYLVVIFYLYAWQAPVPGQGNAEKISVNSAVYQKIIENFRQREINFTQEESRTYLDPFK